MFSRSRLSYISVLCLAAALTLAGCNRRTPEERLQKAVEFARQNDTLSAEVEAKKVIEKNPDDPISIQARVLLAQIYAQDQRFDEARAELEPALDKVSQRDPAGRPVLKLYLEILQADKKFDEAIKTIDQFQEKYAADEVTSLNLSVARAQTQTLAGYTSAARETLTYLHDTTTSPEEMRLYRGMIINTYQRDRDTTGAIAYMEKELSAASTDDAKRGLASELAEMYAALDNYDKAREYAAQITELYDKSMAAELDARMKAAMTFELAKTYLSIGNHQGARVAFQALFDSNPEQPVIMPTAAGLFQVLIEQGDTTAALGFLREAAGRYPTAPFAQQAARLEDPATQSRLADALNTSTLAMRFKQDSALAPKNLPKPVETSATITTSTNPATGETTPVSAIDTPTTSS